MQLNNMAMAIAHLIIMIPFLIFAIILSRGKGGFLFAGYNNLPESEKEKYDEWLYVNLWQK